MGNIQGLYPWFQRKETTGFFPAVPTLVKPSHSGVYRIEHFASLQFLLRCHTKSNQQQASPRRGKGISIAFLIQSLDRISLP